MAFNDDDDDDDDDDDFTEMIAVPDYPLGAMENWGLITYRETAMLYNPVISSEASKQRVTQVITHELSHQVRGYKVK